MKYPQKDVKFVKVSAPIYLTRPYLAVNMPVGFSSRVSMQFSSDTYEEFKSTSYVFRSPKKNNDTFLKSVDIVPII